jgi:putative transposase
MNIGNTSNLIQLIDRKIFKNLVAKWEMDKGVRSFETWEMTSALITAQILNLGSYREVESSLSVARSTLGDALVRRAHGFFEELCEAVLKSIKAKTSDRKIKRALGEILAIDSSECQVHGSLFRKPNWKPKNSNTGVRSASVKLHAVYNVDGEWVEDFLIAPARRNDMPVARGFKIRAGTFLIFDRAYNAVDYWINIVDQYANFVTRLKFCNLNTEQRRRILPETEGILHDGEYVPSRDTLSKLPVEDRPKARFRHIIYRDPKTKKVFDFVTSDFNSDALVICDLYKMRWAVELLFRWLKQHLHIRRLAGKSVNANKTQLAIAVLVQLLVRLKKIGEELSITTWEIIRRIRATIIGAGLVKCGAPADCRWSRPSPVTLARYNL